MKAQKHKTLRDQIISALKKANCYCSLKVIYGKVGAETVSEQAVVRGVLNHEVGTENSAFQRKPEARGMYRCKKVAVKKVEKTTETIVA